MRIVTQYVFPPIPIRTCDWQATLGDPDLGCTVGHGATEEEAKADLRMALIDGSRFDECPSCDSGRVYHGHPNDPEPRSSECRECDGSGVVEVEAEPVEHCPDCNAIVSGDGISIDERACFRCRGD